LTQLTPLTLQTGEAILLDFRDFFERA
jgi:hypothetical protein